MLRRIRPISRAPETAQSVIPLEDKLAFVVDIVKIVLPLIQNKDPENPKPPSGNTATNTEAL